MSLVATGACSTTGKYDKSRNDAILAQLPKVPTITLTAKDTPVVSVLAIVSKQTGIELTVAGEWLAGFPIKADFKDATLAEVLAYIMGDLPSRLVVQETKGKTVKIEIIAPRGDVSSSTKNKGGPESFRIIKSASEADRESKELLMGSAVEKGE
jgi:hypothetical protein